MKQSRIIAIAVIAAGAAILLVAGIFQFRSNIADFLRPQQAAAPAAVAANPTTTAVPANTKTPSIAAPAATEAVTATTVIVAGDEAFKPIWGPNYKDNDGLGRFICGTNPFASYYALQQIQMTGLDVKNGFHLGIVPFQISDEYSASEKDRSEMLKSGRLDCFLTTMDSVALNDPGVVTALIDESAGADQVWARGVATLNDLKGKRIAFEASGVSEFFIYYLLSTVQLDPKTDVQLMPMPTIDDAIASFNAEEADAVVGWEPTIFDAERSGGRALVTTRDFRSIVDVIVTGRQALADKRSVVELFHKAWFEAIEAQQTDFPAAANAITRWGYNDVMGVSVENATDDLTLLLTSLAQANLADNARAVYTPAMLVQRLQGMRQVWASAGYTVPTSDITQLIEPRFIEAAARRANTDLNAPNTLINNSFTLGRELIRDSAVAASTTTTTTVAEAPTAQPTTAAVIASALDTAQAVATLPCTRFEFVPNSTEMQARSKVELQQCAVDVLKQNTALFVRVKGSSAWPGPKGAYTEAQVSATARARAQAVADFLASQGIRAERLVVEWTLPPEDHWETSDVVKQSEDRYVEITLLTSGM